MFITYPSRHIIVYLEISSKNPSQSQWLPTSDSVYTEYHVSSGGLKTCEFAADI